MTMYPLASNRWQAYLSDIEQGIRAGPGMEDTAMLYIFSKNNSVQIAWGSKAPQQKADTRSQELDTRFGPLGFIRTYNAG